MTINGLVILIWIAATSVIGFVCYLWGRFDERDKEANQRSSYYLNQILRGRKH